MPRGSLFKDNVGLTKDFAKIFNESFTLKTNSILGTLSDAVVEQYDLILTNPPYVTSGSSNLKEEVKKDGELQNHYTVNALGVEGLFMEWIIKALKPNGKAFVVVPENMLFRPSDANLRKFILEQCLLEGIISLPKKTFFSTVQQTSIICLTKKKNLAVQQKSPVFTYIVGEVGESRDVNRFDIEQDDLKESIESFKGFKGNPYYFEKHNSDDRCKVIPIQWFLDNFENSWSIEQLWTKKEKIKIGIHDESTIISVNDYKATMQEAIDNIERLKLELDSVASISDVINYTSKPLHEIFKFESGNSKITQAYINKNKGECVVYSSNTKNDGILGYINTYDFNEECIQITTNGVYAGTVSYRKKHKFSINGDARIFIKKEVNLCYQYLVYELQRVFADYNFTWENKPTISKTKDIFLKIPVDENGEYSLLIHEKLAYNLSKAEFVKQSMANEFEKLKNIGITI